MGAVLNKGWHVWKEIRENSRLLDVSITWTLLVRFLPAVCLGFVSAFSGNRGTDTSITEMDDNLSLCGFCFPLTIHKPRTRGKTPLEIVSFKYRRPLGPVATVDTSPVDDGYHRSWFILCQSNGFLNADALYTLLKSYAYLEPEKTTSFKWIDGIKIWFIQLKLPWKWLERCQVPGTCIYTRWWQLKYVTVLFSSRSLGFHDPIWLVHIFSEWVGSTTNQKKSWIQGAGFFSPLMAGWKITRCCLHSANFNEWPNFSKWLGVFNLEIRFLPFRTKPTHDSGLGLEISLSASYIWCIIIHIYICIQWHWSSWFFRCVPCTFQIWYIFGLLGWCFSTRHRSKRAVDGQNLANPGCIHSIVCFLFVNWTFSRRKCRPFEMCNQSSCVLRCEGVIGPSHFAIGGPNWNQLFENFPNLNWNCWDLGWNGNQRLKTLMMTFFKVLMS